MDIDELPIVTEDPEDTPPEHIESELFHTEIRLSEIVQALYILMGVDYAD